MLPLGITTAAVVDAHCWRKWLLIKRMNEPIRQTSSQRQLLSNEAIFQLGALELRARVIAEEIFAGHHASKRFGASTDFVEHKGTPMAMICGIWIGKCMPGKSERIFENIGRKQGRHICDGRCFSFHELWSKKWK